MDDIKGGNKLNKNDVLFITAETGYVKTGLEKSGYRVMHPYKYKTVVGRVVLEVLIRMKLPQTIMFNRKILKTPYKYIIIQDSIVTRQFLDWIKKNYSDSKLIYQYTNMVGKAHHLLPDEIPTGIDIWTYDKHDSDKYGISLSSCGGYYTAFIGEKREKKYDVMYVGKDKGRADYILELKKKFEDMGLTTKFLIMPSTRVSKKKSFYSKPIPYEEVIKLVTESRAILNITLPDQQGATLRDYESMYNEVKLITTNKKINQFDFYKKENIFILDVDDYDSIYEFTNSPFKIISKEILDYYSLDAFVKEIIAI